MDCFYHPNNPAIGICKYCNRGLCSECTTVIDDVIACKNRHESEVHQLEQLSARNLFQSKRVGSNYMRNATFYGLVSIRSEEHTSELQSRENLVCRLLLEKK